jgi:hypothetical protein
MYRGVATALVALAAFDYFYLEFQHFYITHQTLIWPAPGLVDTRLS